MRDLAVEQYHMVYPEWYRSALNQPRGECPVSFAPSLKGKNEPHLKYAYHHSCLLSDYTILLLLYCSVHVSRITTYSPFKTVLGKIGDKYQAYCTTYKTCYVNMPYEQPCLKTPLKIHYHLHKSLEQLCKVYEI